MNSECEFNMISDRFPSLPPPASLTLSPLPILSLVLQTILRCGSPLRTVVLATTANHDSYHCLITDIDINFHSPLHLPTITCFSSHRFVIFLTFVSFFCLRLSASQVSLCLLKLVEISLVFLFLPSYSVCYASVAVERHFLRKCCQQTHWVSPRKQQGAGFSGFHQFRSSRIPDACELFPVCTLSTLSSDDIT